MLRYDGGMILFPFPFFNVLASFGCAVAAYPFRQIPFGCVGSIFLTQYLYNVLVEWVVNYW